MAYIQTRENEKKERNKEGTKETRGSKIYGSLKS
jgi:hypothetical protein